MKYLEEYRNIDLVKQYQKAITEITTKHWKIMEICGGQTHAIVKYGLEQLLPPEITLIHGPGCPVCVTSMEIIDHAIELASTPNIIFTSFGDMLRVPGSQKDLLTVKSEGGNIRIVYSPMDALTLAKNNPEKQIIFFAVGFETTAPATAMAVYQAKQQNINNFSLLVSHVLVPPAISALLSTENTQINGFLAAGHVCTVMGYEDYFPLAKTYHIPIIITGFEPVDILQGIYRCIQQLEKGEATCENQYSRAVKLAGNSTAKQLMSQVFRISDQQWRGIGIIPQSGLELKEEYQQFDAKRRFSFRSLTPQLECADCISGLILQGLKKPFDCLSFGTKCTPEHPLGAPMVSTEGACSAYYRYRQ